MAINWTNRHKFILSDFFSELNNRKIKYFVLRNYEGLPDSNPSQDVDIVIEPGSYTLVRDLLLVVYKKYEITNYKIVRYEKTRLIYGFNPVVKLSIHIDLMEGYLSRGFEVFSFEELFSQTLEYKNFRVLNEVFDAVTLLLYKVISAKQIKNSYKEKISQIYSEKRGEINIILINTLGRKVGNLIINALKESDFDLIIANVNSISKKSKQKSIFKKPVLTVVRIFNFLSEKFYRIVYCPRNYQNFISVQGADGTGKSTFIEGLVNAIAFYNVSEESKSHVYHHRPTVLPNLGSVGEKARVMKEDTDFTNPHRAAPSGFIVSLVRMTYYWLDYLIGVPIMLRKDVQFDRFTIYDRYIYDFLIDPRRSRINLPYWVLKIFTKLVLQPRIVFVLLTDAEVIYKRKQELTINEINRQLGEFKKLANSHKRFVVLDASKSPEELVNDAMKIIIEKFTQKL